MMRLVDCLERVDMKWCAIGSVAVKHWAEEPMVTQDVVIVVTAEDIERSRDRLSNYVRLGSRPSGINGR